MRRLSAFFTVLIALAVAMDAQAQFKIELEPAEVWGDFGGLLQGFKSVGELQAAWNSAQESGYSRCREAHAGSPYAYQCVKVLFTGVIHPAPPLAKANGNYRFFTADAIIYTVVHYANGSSVTSTQEFGYGIVRHLLCPFEQGYRDWVVPDGPNSVRVTCVKFETPPMQCDGAGGGKSGGNGGAGSVGNPIQIASGVKTDSHTDYATADGLLSIERQFLGQLRGWRMPGDANIFDVYSQAVTPAGSGISFIRTFAQNNVVVPVTLYARYIRTTVNGEVLVVNTDGSHTLYPASASGAFPVDVSGDRMEWLGSPTPEGAVWRRTRANEVIEEYGADGRLRKKQLRNGLFVKHYYASGRLTDMLDSRGQRINFAYNADGLMERVTLPDGLSITYGYQNGLLTRVTYPDNTSRQFLYNEPAYVAGTPASYSLTGILDENGARIGTYRYDASQRAISTESAGGVNKYSLVYGSGYTLVTSPLGSVNRFNFTIAGGRTAIASQSQPAGAGCGPAAERYTYDTNGNVASRTDFNGVVTTYGYDLTRNLETSRTEAAGRPEARTVTTTWHPSYRLPTQIIEPGKVTTFVYDAVGNLIQTTVSGGGQNRTVSMQYNGAGQVVSIDGPRTDVSDVTTLDYYTCTTGGGCGQLKSITNALGQTTRFDAYDAHGRVIQQTDPNGLVTGYAYDARGRVTAVGQTPPGGTMRVTRYTYDAAGQLTSVQTPDGGFVSYTYDAAHRLTAIGDAQGNRIQYTLDNIGNRIREDVYDNLGNLVTTKSRVFDALNRLWQDINALNQTTVYGYDAQGNLTQTINPNGAATAHGYDGLNRLLQSVDALAGVTRYGYDAQDRLTQAQAPNNATTQYRHDDLGNLLSETSPDRGTTTYASDSAGNRVSHTDARGVSAQYTYDALNRPTRIDYPGSAEDVTLTYDACPGGIGRLCQVQDESGLTQYTYDAFGNVLTQTFTTDGQTYTTAYAYDAANRIIGMTYPDGRTVSYSRDTLGRIVQVSATVNGVTTVLAGNILHRPDGLIATRTFGNGLIDIRQYNLKGELTYQSLGSDTRLYGYDPNGNLTSKQTIPEADAYGYDALDRLLQESRTTTITTQTAFGYDPNGNRTTQNGQAYIYTAATNRLTQTPQGSITLDALGNTVGDPGRSFTYNNAGRLSSVTISRRTTAYRYNAQGQRTRKDAGPADTTIYHYDLEGRLIAETNQRGVWQRSYVWLDDIPIAQLEAVHGRYKEAVYYLHTDHLNTPRLATDETGKILWRWEGQAFGETLPNEDVDNDRKTVTINLRFAGQYFDAETGLHYNWNRYYDPKIGRYITSDPIGIEGGVNTYAYVQNNPLRWSDPSGLAAQLCLINPAACAAGAAAVWEICKTVVIAIGGTIILTGDTSCGGGGANSGSCTKDRTSDCNAAFRRCYNRKPNDQKWTNDCSKSLEVCLSNPDVTVIFPNGDVVNPK